MIRRLIHNVIVHPLLGWAEWLHDLTAPEDDYARGWQDAMAQDNPPSEPTR